MAATTDQTVDDVAAAEPSRSPLRVVLTIVIVVALLAATLAGGFYWGAKHGDPSRGAKPSAVDIGFARDMSIHHQQAVTMAGYARDNSSNPDVVHLAYDIETNQSIEMGEMTGWLDSWGLTRYSPHPMAWMGDHGMHMGAGSLMPGLATSAQMAGLMS